MPPKVILKVRTRMKQRGVEKWGVYKRMVQTLKWQFTLAIPYTLKISLEDEHASWKWFLFQASIFRLRFNDQRVWRLEDGIASLMESLGLAIEDYSEPKYIDSQ